MGIGARLKELREKAGLDQVEAARIGETSKQSVSQIENGRTKVPGGMPLYLWSRHYGVNLEWLITGKGARDPKSQSPRPDPQIIAAAIQLGRRAFLEFDDETFDPEKHSDVVVAAYMFLLARGQTKATRANVIDFANALQRGEKGGTERGRGTGQAGSVGGEARQARSPKAAKAAGGGVR